MYALVVALGATAGSIEHAVADVAADVASAEADVKAGVALVEDKAQARVGKAKSNFRVCGYYCGPGWCDNGWHSEWNSDSNHCGPDYIAPQKSPFSSSPACADVCCMKHDECCAPGGTDKQSTAGCNKMIVDCLAACDALDMSCLEALDVPVAAGAVWAAMDLVEDWCCGSPCDK
jgi:hypothetical protein